MTCAILVVCSVARAWIPGDSPRARSRRCRSTAFSRCLQSAAAQPRGRVRTPGSAPRSGQRRSKTGLRGRVGRRWRTSTPSRQRNAQRNVVIGSRAGLVGISTHCGSSATRISNSVVTHWHHLPRCLQTCSVHHPPVDLRAQRLARSKKPPGKRRKKLAQSVALAPTQGCSAAITVRCSAGTPRRRCQPRCRWVRSPPTSAREIPLVFGFGFGGVWRGWVSASSFFVFSFFLFPLV